MIGVGTEGQGSSPARVSTVNYHGAILLLVEGSNDANEPLATALNGMEWDLFR